jgi:hypothetical protein
LQSVTIHTHTHMKFRTALKGHDQNRHTQKKKKGRGLNPKSNLTTSAAAHVTFPCIPSSVNFSM